MLFVENEAEDFEVDCPDVVGALLGMCSNRDMYAFQEGEDEMFSLPAGYDQNGNQKEEQFLNLAAQVMPVLAAQTGSCASSVEGSIVDSVDVAVEIAEVSAIIQLKTDVMNDPILEAHVVTWSKLIIKIGIEEKKELRAKKEAHNA
jgi:hypothetical protein